MQENFRRKEQCPAPVLNWSIPALSCVAPELADLIPALRSLIPSKYPASSRDELQQLA